MHTVPWFIPQRNQIRDIKLLSCSDLFNSNVMNLKKKTKKQGVRATSDVEKVVTSGNFLFYLMFEFVEAHALLGI